MLVYGFGARKQNDRPYATLAMPFNFILSFIPSVSYGNASKHDFSYVCHTMYIVI